MPSIKHHLDLGALGEDVACTVEYDFTAEDRSTNCPEEIVVNDVAIEGIVLSPHNLSCLIADLQGDDQLLAKISDREANRYHDEAADRAEFMRDMER